MLKNNNILVLGGSGFIGTNIVKHYNKKKYKIFATYYKSKPRIYSKKIKWIKANLLNESNIIKLFNMTKYKYVIQCAAVTAGVQSMKSDPFIFISGNAIMNSLLIKWSVHFRVRHFIFLSCTVMYHNSRKYLKESDYDIKRKIHPNYEGIAYTKTYIENICKFYSNNSNTKFTALRHSNIYGPYDKFNNVKGHFMSSIISKVYDKNNFLEVWGNGVEKRDFLYVNDFLKGIDLVLAKQKNKFEIFNMTYGESFSLKTIIKKIIFISKTKKIPQYHKDKPTIKIDILVNSSKAYNVIGWKSKTNIDEGIKKTIHWFKSLYVNQK